MAFREIDRSFGRDVRSLVVANVRVIGDVRAELVFFRVRADGCLVFAMSTDRQA